MAETIETPLWWNNAWGPWNGVTDMMEVVRQLMKVLILTVPGENPSELDVNFGVGLRNILFMNDYPGLRTDLETRIRSQINTYIRAGDTGRPMVRLLGVKFSPYPISDAEPKLSVRISYTILLGTSESEQQDEDIPLDGPDGTSTAAENLMEANLFVDPGFNAAGQLDPMDPWSGIADPPILATPPDGRFGELKWKRGP